MKPYQFIAVYQMFLLTWVKADDGKWTWWELPILLFVVGVFTYEAWLAMKPMWVRPSA
jgi:hypothetical protein